MKTRGITAVLAMLSLALFGRIAHSGNLTVELYGVDGKPVTNATVTVKSSKGVLWGRGCNSEYNFTSAKSDDKGIASVNFRIIDSDFTWELETPSHYSQCYNTPREFFDCEVVESEYSDINTNTVDGLARYNELKQLYEANDEASYTNLIAKLEPKSVKYTNKSIRRSAIFYPKKNPQPMYAYGEDDWPKMSIEENVVRTNGHVLIVYPAIDVDLKNFKCRNSRGVDLLGSDYDFRFERYYIETNGVGSFYGRMVFAPGCGAYRRKKTGDESFPSTYVADKNATYEKEIVFYTDEELKSGKVLNDKRLLDEDEYMVIKTRACPADHNNTGRCHYSKLIGPGEVHGSLYFKQSVFNPRLNDTNLEFDMNRNLARPKYPVRYP